MESDGTRDAVGCGEGVREGETKRQGDKEMGRNPIINYQLSIPNPHSSKLYLDRCLILAT